MDDLKHVQKGRLIYLDQCFAWRGIANRRDLTERFDISVAQAALDFKVYLERSTRTPPRYDAARKAYFAMPEHQSLFPDEVYQNWEAVILEGDGNHLDRLPSLNRLSEPQIVSRLYQAIENNLAIHIQYTSMSTGKDSGQWIVPTQFVSDGERVHMRAYSYKHKSYRDYIPVRINLKSRFATRVIENDLPRDEDWETLARIILAPKSTLSLEQAKAVRREYGFRGKTLSVEIRKALEFYTNRRWGLDLPNARLERIETHYRPLD